MKTVHGLTREQWAFVYGFQILRTFRDVFGHYPRGMSYGEMSGRIVAKVGRAMAWDMMKRQPQHCPADYEPAVA